MPQPAPGNVTAAGEAEFPLAAVSRSEIALITGGNPYYTEEANILAFLQNPDTGMLEALLLKFKPLDF